MLPPLFFLLFSAVFSQKAFSQFAAVGHRHEHAGGPLNFIENKNQWDKSVLFKTNFEGANTIFIQRQGFTFLMADPADIEKMNLAHKTSAGGQKNITIHQHAYRVDFLGSSISEGKGIAERSVYHNYFLGNDPAKWSGHVRLFGKVRQENIYPGIHLETYSQSGHLKYDFIVSPGSDPSLLRLKYTGAEQLQLVAGDLEVHTSIGKITELNPVAYQETDGKRVAVPCYFQLNNEVVSYTFPEGYDETKALVIDPTLIASTLTGTTGSSNSYGNFGHSATFDNGGNIYAAGISFVSTFPATTGAFQTYNGGGDNDIAIVKYNPDGTNLIYATYIGGGGADYPHSLITDFNQQLYIYGSTNSMNYPVTANAFQKSNAGGREIVVTILNQDGSALVGSSYFGGSGDDGYNENFSMPTHSYGDEFRGEIVIDGQNNVYVVSNTQSFNFPATSNAFATSLNNNGFVRQDAVVFKSNSDLSLLYWATYLGGSDLDSGNGIRVDENLDVYVTGTAGEGNFPTTPGTVQPNWPGGDESGYLAKLSADGSTLLASTFFGTNADDNSYFLDIDEDDQIHIFGKTKGSIAVSPAGTYSGAPGSNQFLAAFSNDLTSTVYRTVVGNGPNLFGYDFVPVAFMVDKCNGIYFSGYRAGPGLPTTAGSFPDIAVGPPDFYLGVLTPLAQQLKYATYYGEADHVDGGTSRFDKGGVIYQGVCSCQWPSDPNVLTTLPNAWATSQQTGCDLGVFKLDLEIEAINANGIALPATAGCAPFDVDFKFTGTNATEFEWSIDQAVVSNLPDHSYTFNEPGVYQVQLAVANPTACNPRDTFNLEIVVLEGESTLTDTAFCAGDELFLDATTPNAVYTWQNGSTAASFVVQQPGTYWVDIDIGGCARRDSFVVSPNTDVVLDLGPDTSFCDVNSFVINAAQPGIVSFLWQDGSNAPTFTATDDGLYSVFGIDTSGCTVADEIELVFGQTPSLDLGPDELLCGGETLTLNPDLQGSQALWQDGSTSATFQINSPGTYWLQLDNDGCLAADTININYYPDIEANTSASSIVCASDCNGTVSTNPSGGSGTGFSIQWSNGATQPELAGLCPGPYTVTITDSNDCTVEETAVVNAPPLLEMVLDFDNVTCAGDMDGAVQALVTGGLAPYRYSFNGGGFTSLNGIFQLSGGVYDVLVVDSLGCSVSESVTIGEPGFFSIDAGPDQLLDLGESTELNGVVLPFNGQVIAWTPPDFLDCTDCLAPSLCPTQTTQYLLTVTDPASGCFLTDSVLVTVDKKRRIYIPNAFSPNDDGVNDFFTVFAGIGVLEISEFKVFDRWGELVFENYNFQPNDVTQGWDGTLKGEDMNPAVFVYFVKVLFKDEETLFYEGDIHLLR